MLQPLLDRIEIIHVPAYLPIEKIKIAQKYLVPRFEQEYGFQGAAQGERVRISDAALIKVVNQYCGHEAGVRNLRKCLDRVFRKIVAKMEAAPQQSESVKEYQVTTKNLERFLDVPPTDDHYYEGINQGLPVGSSNGLAYVDDGQGSVLKI
jgi:ATP-dependent Lon protease